MREGIRVPRCDCSRACASLSSLRADQNSQASMATPEGGGGERGGEEKGKKRGVG